MNEAAALLTRHKLTVYDYHRMADAGILGEAERVELIDGEIIDMAAIGSGHASVVGRITQVLVLAFQKTALVWVQNPVWLDEYNEPQPDFAVLKPRADFYASQHPGPADILLLVEVGDSSLRYDRDVKLPLYARAGIPEVWIVDLRRRMLSSHRLPSDGRFTQDSPHRAGEALRLAAVPDVTVLVDDLLGGSQQAA